MIFKYPLWFLAFIPLVLAWIWRSRRLQRATIRFSRVGPLRNIAHKRTYVLSRMSIWVRVAILACAIVALARPQGVFEEREVSSQGIDIMIALDVSRSMAAEDLTPKNRLEVAKKTVTDFVLKRENDRMGLVVYSGEAFTQVPLTYDAPVLTHFVDQLYLDMAGEGTAIGLAIATALNRLKESKAASKIIILLTDGENNRGEINPLSAAELAKTMGVKIYTIGVGKPEGAPIPFVDEAGKKQYLRDPYGRIVKTSIDEETLKQIAVTTQGKYFRAVDKTSLEQIYNTIDTLEKSEIKTTVYRDYVEYFPKVLAVLLALMVLELLITQVFLVVVP